MILLKIEDVKAFMNTLLRDSTFDNFDVRTVDITTFIAFHIDCGVITEQAEDTPKSQDYAKWKDIKPYVFNMIKGGERPKLIKLVFSCDKEKAERYENAKVLYLNVTFKEESLTITTGMQQKEFSLDKTTEMSWDNAIKKYLEDKGFKTSDEQAASNNTFDDEDDCDNFEEFEGEE